MPGNLSLILEPDFNRSKLCSICSSFKKGQWVGGEWSLAPGKLEKLYNSLLVIIRRTPMALTMPESVEVAFLDARGVARR
ncbi:hypothetical protein GJ744_010333 [Endocarpon pusillum]|uniref:Uncharacterized protein n=1 Tax=Endocarpon pusillum TaxID=364733 RepID=A0A8H7AGN8_9EURO|nr:hypothetical protein GJ744_010333 [Endocarpon pusillum]